MVEAAGIEPASEVTQNGVSTSLALAFGSHVPAPRGQDPVRQPL